MSLQSIIQQRDSQERYVNEGIIVGKNEILFGKIPTYNVRVIYGNEKIPQYCSGHSEILIQVPFQEAKEGFVPPELEEGQKVVLGYLNNDLNSPYIINNGISSVPTGTGGNSGGSDDGGNTPSSSVITSAANIQDGSITVTIDGKSDTRKICDNTKWVYSQCINKGFTLAATCGILGNIVTESSFNPEADNGNHHGIAQWGYGSGGGRWPNAKTWMDGNGYAKQYDSIEAQTAFLIYDLVGGIDNNTNASSKGENTWVAYVSSNLKTTPLTHLTSVPDSEENAILVADQLRMWYERCGEQGMEKRRQYAAAYYHFFETQNMADQQPKQSDANSKPHPPFAPPQIDLTLGLGLPNWKDKFTSDL